MLQKPIWGNCGRNDAGAVKNKQWDDPGGRQDGIFESADKKQNWTTPNIQKIVLPFNVRRAFHWIIILIQNLISQFRNPGNFQIDREEISGKGGHLQQCRNGKTWRRTWGFGWHLKKIVRVSRDEGGWRINRKK